MYFPKFDWPRITNPKLTFPLTDEHIAQTVAQEEIALAQIHSAIENNRNAIACLILEPIQSEGGDNHFRKEFFHALRKICDTHDILLILDEVQTGIAMTGKMWAYQHYGIVPDVIAFGKKTQVCGILANREKFDRVNNHVFKESSRINSTFGGNLVDMVRFKLILEVIEKENLTAQAYEKGNYLLAQIKSLVADFPQLSNPRGKGLLCSFDFEDEQTKDRFVHDAFEQKLLILGCGDKSIRFRPHLNVSFADIDDAFTIIRNILSK